jgi:glucose 1-dehydrogenase
MQLEGRVALVTGAGSGIGHAIAERFGAEGASVCINYLGYAEGAQELAQKLTEQRRKSIAVEGDVTNREQVQSMMDRTVSELGGLDILVNNAGIEKSVPFLDIDDQTWETIVSVDLRGVFICSQVGGRAMRDSGKGGSIINISSIHEDYTFPGYTPYCAAKGGVRMLMRNAALELAKHKIRVNNIAPGAIATPINEGTLHDPEKLEALRNIVPLGGMGQPSQVASVAVFLASDESSYVTGSTYYVDGGLVRYALAV